MVLSIHFFGTRILEDFQNLNCEFEGSVKIFSNATKKFEVKGGTDGP